MPKISKQVLEFLAELSENNDREWFLQNKERYQAAQQNVLDFVTEFYQLLGQNEPEYLLSDPKKSMFRIYKDVRFSKDKTPYKEHFGVVISPDGKKSHDPSMYLQISPKDTFLAAGRWRPDKEELSQIRQEIDYNGKTFEDLVNNLPEGFSLDTSDSLKRPPKGYDKENQNINYIKLKSFVVSSRFPQEWATEEGFYKQLEDIYQKLKPFNKFLKDAKG